MGHSGRTRAARSAATCRCWADAIVGGWTVSTIFQARSGPHLTPYFTYGDTGGIYPANTGRTLDGVGQFGEAWRPDVTGDPNTGGTRAQFYDLTKFTLPAPGTLGNAKKGSVQGPGTWIVNFAFYKDIVRTRGFSAEFTALLDNAFNHPQFVVGLGTGGFMDLTDYLINGVADERQHRGARRGHRGQHRRLLGGTGRAVRDPVAVLTTLPPEIRDESAARGCPRRAVRRPIVDCVSRLNGDILIIGAAGKMGPSLARRVHRAAARAGSRSRVLAVSRFSTPAVRERLEADGIQTDRVRSARSRRRSPRCRAPRTCCFSRAGSSARSTAPTSRGPPTRWFPRAWRSTSRSRAWSCSRPGTSIRWSPADGPGVQRGRSAGAGGRVRAIVPRTRARGRVRVARAEPARAHLPAQLRRRSALRHARGHRAQGARRRGRSI